MAITLFLSETKLRQFTTLNDNVSTELLRNAVREAQTIEIQRIIGTKLYDKLASEVQADTLSGDYKTLMDDYVQYSLLYWAYYYALEEVLLRPRNNGLLQPNGGENSNAVDRDLYEMKRTSVRNKAEWYSNKLSEYILDKGSSVYPELGQTTDIYEDIPDYTTQFKTPFAFRNQMRGDIEWANQAGVPWTYGKGYSFLPPPNSNKIKIK